MSTKKLLINAVGSKAGGGLNDLAHTLPLMREMLGEHGWEIDACVVPAGAEVLRQSGFPMNRVETVAVQSPLSRAKWEYRTFPSIVKQRKPDVVFQFSNLIFRKLASPQMTVLRSPTFYNPEYAARSRSGAYLTMRYLIGKRVAASTVRIADEVFCISGAQRDDIIETVGKEGEKVQVSYLGLDVPERAKQLCGASRQEQIAKLSSPLQRMMQPEAAARPIVLNVAHYYEHKNLCDLLIAMRQVREQNPDALLVMTSGLTRYSGPWTERTRLDAAAAKQLEAEGGLVDLGPVARDDVWPLMALADVFAFPSSLESFGHPLLEAMSMRLPIVAADTRVHREIAGEHSDYHQVGDVNGLAQAVLRRLGEGPDEQSLDRASAYAATFSWQRHAQQLADAVLSLAQ